MPIPYGGRKTLHIYSIGRHKHIDRSVQFSSVTQSCLTPCDPMDCSTPGFPVHHQFLEPAPTHVHRVVDVIQSIFIDIYYYIYFFIDIYYIYLFLYRYLLTQTQPAQIISFLWNLLCLSLSSPSWRQRHLPKCSGQTPWCHGIILFSSLSFIPHIHYISKSCWHYHLNIFRIELLDQFLRSLLIRPCFKPSLFLLWTITISS